MGGVTNQPNPNTYLSDSWYSPSNQYVVSYTPTPSFTSSPTFVSTPCVVWVQTPSNEYGGGNAVKVDTSGNVYVVSDGNLLKYSSSGTLLWNLQTGAKDAAIDAAGNLYVIPASGTAT